MLDHEMWQTRNPLYSFLSCQLGRLLNPNRLQCTTLSYHSGVLTPIGLYNCKIIIGWFQFRFVILHVGAINHELKDTAHQGQYLMEFYNLQHYFKLLSNLGYCAHMICYQSFTMQYHPTSSSPVVRKSSDTVRLCLECLTLLQHNQTTHVSY